MDHYARLRSKTVLLRAWKNVRASGLSSDSDRTRSETLEFEADLLGNLDRLQAKLRRGQFDFPDEKGIALRKGKDKSGYRPLVVAPVANRIVRRAILDVLQGYPKNNSAAELNAVNDKRKSWPGIPAVRAVMATPTSVGGIPERGVAYAIALVVGAIKAGNSWFAKSDIRDFFTRIPREVVSRFISDAVNDDAFAKIFDLALETNLVNEEELRERNKFVLFPNAEVGVAQGSALSALAGNIALQEFDFEMNGRGILCVRYIDDFIVLGPTRAKVVAAFRSAQARLQKLGMDVYDPMSRSAQLAGKADIGNVHNGVDLLGYRLSGLSLQPSRSARRKLVEKIDIVVDACRRDLRVVAEKSPEKSRIRLGQALCLINEIAWGWSQSFAHTTARHVLQEIDREIDAGLNEIFSEFERLQQLHANEASRRRLLGVHLLGDIMLRDLPRVDLVLSGLLPRTSAAQTA